MSGGIRLISRYLKLPRGTSVAHPSVRQPTDNAPANPYKQVARFPWAQARGHCKRLGRHDRQVLSPGSVRRHRGRWWGIPPFSGFQDRRKPEKVQMQNITQPFVKLSTANAALITRFAQSPEMLELANSSAQKYFELAQKTFGKAAASEAQADLIRRLTENYSTFAQEYSQSLI